ncbi:MAG: ABC transporter permease [Solirubrobacterales bacterium]|nr:ABC transporter permease [Solirubrobacterales bacterium]
MSERQVVPALIRRALNELIRVPGAAIPGVLAPTIFMLGLTAVFGQVTHLPGFEGVDQYIAFVLPVGLLQGAGFTGAATGVNMARDIEQGWFDRLLLAPVSRPMLLAGIVGSAALRALIPTTTLVLVGIAFGVKFPSLAEIFIAASLVMILAASTACWGAIIALKFRTQQAAPLMQIGSFVAVLFTAAYAPMEMLKPWMHAIATVNPVNYILAGVRQGFIGEVTWSDTWPAYAAGLGLLAVLATFAVRGMRRTGQ